jgi:hypothetical protein
MHENVTQLLGFSLKKLDTQLSILEAVYVLNRQKRIGTTLLHPPLVEYFSAAPLPRFFLPVIQPPPRKGVKNIASP